MPLLRRDHQAQLWHATTLSWNDVNTDVVVLEDLYEIFADSGTAVITVAGRIKRKLACGCANRCRFDVRDQLFGPLDQRVSMYLG